LSNVDASGGVSVDWATILSSTGLSAAVFGGLSLLLKKSVENSLAVFFETVKEERKARIQEEVRRQAKLFDRQFESFSTVLALVYRARNASRELRELLENAEPEKGLEKSTPHHKGEVMKAVSDLRKRIVTYHRALEELLFQDRIYFSGLVFSLAHESKGVIMEIDSLVKYAQHADDEKGRQARRRLSDAVTRLDSMYEALVAKIQTEAGVEAGT
jgi:hypothetical protein